MFFHKYTINICKLFKRCYYLGDILDVTGKKFKRHALSLTHRGFHLHKFPRIKLPKTFESVWAFAVRKIMYQTGIDRNLGDLVSTESVEWCTDELKNFLIRQRYGRPSSIYMKHDNNYFRKAPSSLRIPIQSV